MTHRIRSFLAIFSLTFLAACQTTTGPSNTMSAATATASLPAKSVDQRIQESADRVAEGIKRLAAVQASRASSTAAANPPASVASQDIPSELSQEMQVSWTGPVDALASAIAQQIGYRFQAIGRRPATAVIVRIESERRAVVDILRDAALQTNNRASLVVNPNEKLVELRYAAQ